MTGVLVRWWRETMTGVSSLRRVCTECPPLMTTVGVELTQHSTGREVLGGESGHET